MRRHVILIHRVGMQKLSLISTHFHLLPLKNFSMPFHLTLHFYGSSFKLPNLLLSENFGIIILLRPDRRHKVTVSWCR